MRRLALILLALSSQLQAQTLDELMLEYADQSVEDFSPKTGAVEPLTEQEIESMADSSFQPDETCTLYICLLDSEEAYSEECVKARLAMIERTASNAYRLWNPIPPIELYPKCVTEDSDPHAQDMSRSYSSLIEQEADPSNPKRVTIEPGTCKKADDGDLPDVIKVGDCYATLRTYKPIVFGEQHGMWVHVNEDTLETFLQDPVTMMAERDQPGTQIAPVSTPTQDPENGDDPEDSPVIDPVEMPIINNPKDLPYNGIFYGNPTGGVHTANSQIAVNNSRRFRAERSGDVLSVRYHNRSLLQSDIDYRCKLYGRGGSNGKWCGCKDSGLDPVSCSYTLGSSYMVGNGGLITISIRPDDGNGYPSSTILAKSAPYVPYSLERNGYPAIKLTSPARLTAGTIYHIVYSNSKPPIKCGLSNVSASKASGCERDRGAMGLNGVFYPHTSTTTGRLGPWYGTRSSANLYQSGGGWKLYGKNLSWYELAYSDGVNVGDTYHALNVTKGTMKRDIQGSTQARQRFTVTNATRKVTGVWLNFGHTPSANGSALSVALKDKNGATLASGRISASSHCRSKAKGVKWDRHCRDWGYTSFGKTVELKNGSEYSVVFSAGSGAGFSMSTVEPLSQSHPFNDRNNWTRARGEISTNGGGKWGAWDARLPDERDMTVLFTIEGMPVMMP